MPPDRRHQCLFIWSLLTQMLFNLCRTADCITTRETWIYPCHRPHHWCVLRLRRWKIWSSRWCGNHVYMYIVSSPTHLHCIYIYTMYVSNFHCWWQCWSASICYGSFHDCMDVGRLVSLVSLIVWHSAAAPLLLLLIDNSSYPSNIPTRRPTVLHRPSELTPDVSDVRSLSWTMTTTGYLFFSFQLPGLCSSGACVFFSGNRNSRRELVEEASAWITEVYRGMANRRKHLPSEKLNVFYLKGCTPRSMSSTQTLRICVSSFYVFIMITCEWTSLWKLLADCTSTMPDYCSADVFMGRHISSYNMVQFECTYTSVQCSHCSCIALWHVVMPPIARGQTC